MSHLFSKILLIAIFLPLFSYGQIDLDNLIDLPEGQRLKLLRQAVVFSEASKSQNGPLDVIEFLRETCGFDYQRSTSGHPIRPQVECRYQPKPVDNPFGGMMAKFQCLFESGSEKPEKLKVKYDPYHQDGGGYKEIPQAILGTLFGAAMGLEGSVYCPVDLICLDCPSNNPWDLERSQAPAQPGSRYEFKSVVIEKKLKGEKILQSNPSQPTHPIAFYFDPDLMNELPEENRDEARADREALLIWTNFIRHHDAGAYNMALTCRKPEFIQGEISCRKVVASVNDYGNSFGYKRIREKMQLSRFESAKGVVLRGGQLKTSGADGTSNPEGVTVSQRGLDRFLEAVRRITPENMNDIFELAQISKVSDSPQEKWEKSFQEKVKDLERLKR